MDILDVHIVRIKDHDTESDLSLDLLFAVDHTSYPPVPKKVSWRTMISYIATWLFTVKIYTVKAAMLRDSVPYAVTFPTEFETDYIILPTFIHGNTQTGLTITNESSTGFTVTATGEDVTLDFAVIPLTPTT